MTPHGRHDKEFEDLDAHIERALADLATALGERVDQDAVLVSVKEAAILRNLSNE